jgi:hypothetical protein
MAKIDFTAYLFKDHRTLSGSYLARCKKHLAQLPKPNPFQASSNKPQATSSKLRQFVAFTKEKK